MYAMGHVLPNAARPLLVGCIFGNRRALVGQTRAIAVLTAAG